NLLKLDSLDHLAWGGWSGSVITPGSKENSILYQRITLAADDDKHMPLKQGTLTKREIATIGKWIDAGAYGSDYSPTMKQKNSWITSNYQLPLLPKTSPPKTNPIDNFINALAKKKGHTLSGTTPSINLVRRLYLQLTGLPPSEAQVNSFLLRPDKSKLIEKLLNSQAYAERWASLWLDLNAYADSTGNTPDADRRGAYFYRDQVIKSLKNDWPINKMILFQIVGDSIPLKFFSGREHLAANLYGGPDLFTNSPGLTIFSKHQNMMERTIYSNLGMDISCARCHNHPELPISQRNYYQLISAFKNIEVLHLNLRENLIEDDIQYKKELREAHPRQLKDPAFLKKVHRYYRQQKPLKIISKVEAQEIHVRKRGVFSNKGEKVSFALPDIFRGSNARIEYWKKLALERYPEIKKTPYNLERLALALWLTDSEQGVGKFVARVFVDSVWRAHFGRGLASSPRDWSSLKSAAPMHAPLLNWLSLYLIKNNWSLKKLNQLIASSEVFARASATSKRSLAQAKSFYHRWYPVKLSAEMVRDSITKIGVGLKLKPYGPSDWPYLSLDSNQNYFKNDWFYNSKEIRERRSVYAHRKRNRPYPALGAFGLPK
ncbi:MAG: DUF1549 domain-containing protein, partial [Halobacteriovoraceae bacterium]|nr:DUF1549 domain-containing protein [Halobacteriovoraceae bacterium]